MQDFRTQDPYLRQRYGLKEKSLPSWVYFAVIFVIGGGIWFGWSANFHSHPKIQTQLISYQSQGNKGISVKYSFVKAKPDSKFQCLLTASDHSSNLVGQYLDNLPLEKSGIRQIEIPTRSLAAVAQIDSCAPVK